MSRKVSGYHPCLAEVTFVRVIVIRVMCLLECILKCIVYLGITRIKSLNRQILRTFGPSSQKELDETSIAIIAAKRKVGEAVSCSHTNQSTIASRPFHIRGSHWTAMSEETGEKKMASFCDRDLTMDISLVWIVYYGQRMIPKYWRSQGSWNPSFFPSYLSVNLSRNT